jgi:hypothetical protein
MRLLLLAILLLTGCSSIQSDKTDITFYSYPAGAKISQGGKNFGAAPVTLTFTRTPNTLTTNPLTATWMSGATTTLPISFAPYTTHFFFPDRQTYTFQRPQGANGTEVDIQWAIYLEQQNKNQREERAAALKQLGEGFKSYGESITPKSTSCTSSVYGNQVYTNCR